MDKEELTHHEIECTYNRMIKKKIIVLSVKFLALSSYIGKGKIL